MLEERFEHPRDPGSHVVGGLVHLVGSPMSKRFQMTGRKKSSSEGPHNPADPPLEGGDLRDWCTVTRKAWTAAPGNGQLEEDGWIFELVTNSGYDTVMSGLSNRLPRIQQTCVWRLVWASLVRLPPPRPQRYKDIC